MNISFIRSHLDELSISAILAAIFGASDFVSRNIHLTQLPPKLLRKGIVPIEITEFWSSVISKNIFIGVVCIVLAILIIFLLLKTVEFEFVGIHKPSILLILIAFIIGAYLWRFPESNLDFYRYYQAAKTISKIGLINYIIEWSPSKTDLPFIPMLYGIIFNFLGISRVAIQIFKTICFTATVYLTYWLGSRLWNQTVGIYSGLILMGIIPFIFQIPTTLVDIPYVFLVVLFTSCVIITYHHKKWYVGAIFTLLLIPLVLLSKGSSVIYIPTIFIGVTLFAIFQTNNRKDTIVRSFFISLSAFVILVISTIIFSQKIRLLYESTSQRRPWIQGAETSSIIHVITRLLSDAWTIRNPLGWIQNSIILLGIIVFATSFFAILYLFKKRDSKFILLIAWMVLPLFFLPGGHRIDLVRYLFPSLPVFAIASAFILSRFRKKIGQMLLISVILSSFLTASIMYVPLRNVNSMTAEQSACDLVNSLDVDSVGLVHIAETADGKRLISHSGQLMIHFEYQLSPDLQYYTVYELIELGQRGDDLPDVLILVSDTYYIPDFFDSFLSFNYRLISVKEGYLGGAWSPLICRIFVTRAE